MRARWGWMRAIRTLFYEACTFLTSTGAFACALLLVFVLESSIRPRLQKQTRGNHVYFTPHCPFIQTLFTQNAFRFTPSSCVSSREKQREELRARVRYRDAFSFDGSGLRAFFPRQGVRQPTEQLLDLPNPARVADETRLRHRERQRRRAPSGALRFFLRNRLSPRRCATSPMSKAIVLTNDPPLQRPLPKWTVRMRALVIASSRRRFVATRKAATLENAAASQSFLQIEMGTCRVERRIHAFGVLTAGLSHGGLSAAAALDVGSNLLDQSASVKASRNRLRCPQP